MNSKFSSFGPFGRSKLMSNSIGSRIVASDGEQLTGHRSHVNSCSVANYLQKQCIYRSSLRGDGTQSLGMKFEYLASRLCESIGSGNHGWHSRIDGIHSINAIIRAFSLRKMSVQDHFIATGVWRGEYDIQKWVHDCCRTILIPSCDALTAQALVSILSRLLLKSDSSYHDVAALSSRILDSSDAVLFSTVDAASTMDLQGVSSVTPYFVPMTEMILLGNCYDLPALSRSSLASNEEKPFKFLCIHHLVEEASSYTVSTTSNPQLTTGPVNGTIIVLVQYLLQFKVNVILTEDTVSEGILHLLSSSGVYLIDRVPVVYLQYLTERCQSRLHYSASDFVDYCVNDTLTSSDPTCFGYFSVLKRLKFIEGNYQQSDRKASFLHITGLVTGDKSSGVMVMPQLIVRYLNLTQCGTCNRLIKRCLKALRYSGVSDNEKSRGKMAATDETVPIVVPGGGVADMVWAQMWSAVGERLEHRLHSGEAIWHASDNQEKLFDDLAEAVASQFADIHSVDVRRRVLSQCVFLCRTIAEAYFIVPRQLLLSCTDLMDLPEKCQGLCGGDKRPKSKFDRMWSHWLSVVRSPKHRECPDGVIAVTDLTSLDMCKFGNPFECGIVKPHAHFESEFFELLESIRLLYRVGTDEAIKIKKKSV